MPIGGDRKRERAAAAAAATVGSTQDNGAGSSIVNQRAAAGSWAPTIPKKKQRVGDSRDKEVTVIDEDTAAHDVVEIVPSPRRGAAAPLASRAEGGCSRYGQQHEKRIADADVHAEHDAMRCLSPELLVFNDSDWLDAAVCKPWESSKVDFTAKDRRELLQLDITSHPTFHAPHSEMPRASASRRLSSLPPPSRRVTLRIDASKVRHLSTVTLVDDTKSAGGREIAALLLHLSSGLPMTEITTNPSKGLRQAVKQILITFTCSGKELEAAVSKLPQRWEALRANAGGKISPLFVKQSKANPDRAGKANASSPPAHGPQYFHYECWVEKLGCAPDVAKTADQAGEAWEAVDECQMDEGQMDDGSGLHDIDDDDSGLHNNDVPAVSQSQVAQVGTGGTSETKARLHAHAVAPVPDAKAVKTRADGTASSSSGIPSSSIGMRTTRASTASMASSGRPPPPESKKNQGSPGDVLFVFPFHQQGADTVTVTRADLDTLQDEELLNDTIMDFYIKHIESNLDQETKQQCHFFSTFFWKRLNQEKDARARHAGVAKWTRKVDIFSKRFLFVPICDSLHWTLAILCAPEGIGQLDEGGSGGGAHQSGEFARCELPDDKGGKLLHITLYLDSLGGYKKDAIEKLADYLRMEWLAKKAPGQAEASRNDDASTCYGICHDPSLCLRLHVFARTCVHASVYMRVCGW